MSTSNANLQNSIDSSQSVRHSKADALSEREFELLLEGAATLRDPYTLQARFVILVAGRLGLRLGELTHLSESWVNWRKRMLVIPRFQPCDKGSDGGVCGLCAQQARQKAGTNDDVTIAEAEAASWSPKTDAGARAVPFSFDPRTELAIERFFERWDRWPRSHTAVRRRVKRSAEEAPELSKDEIYPHCLRSSAATWHAARGLSGLELQGMFGWADLSTADNYVARSPENLARALHQIHSR